MSTRENPYSTAYDLYGDPDKLVEFRVMSLNHCSMDCKGCFYKKNNNTYDDWSSARDLCLDMISNGYKMETCYLLPTDIFDNPDNYNLFDIPEFVEMLSRFSYAGIASTLENGHDDKLFDIVYSVNSDIRVELQVNLVINRLFDINYQMLIRRNINILNEKYGDRIVINLAINTGFALTEREVTKLKSMLSEISEDGIVELNFTFLYNTDISEDKKKSMMAKSIATVNTFGNYYQSDASFVKQYNDRTFMRKPSFTFIGSPNRIYTNPIVPFDEYTHIEKPIYLLQEPSYNGFLDCYGEITDINIPIIEECAECDNLQHCMGKYYFAIAEEFDLGCHKLYKEL